MTPKINRPGPGPIPVVPGFDKIRHLPGGHSHETFLAEQSGQTVVLRVYGAGVRTRGPEAPSVQMGVLLLTHGLIPVAEVIDFKEGPNAYLAMSRLPGVSLHKVLKSADASLQRQLGTSMGEILGRLSGIALSGPGPFLDHQQTLGPLDPESFTLTQWLDKHWAGSELESLGAQAHETLSGLCRHSDGLLATSKRACLTHGDLSPRNLLCDPDAGVITGVVDWEFAHAGHPMEDAGKLIRRVAGSEFADAALESLCPWLPKPEQASVIQLKERARAADLYWLIEVASRRGQTPATERAWRLLNKMIRKGRLLAEL
ncbi:MAG: phosphotransferase [Nocardioidaceae bacterium]